MLPACQYSTVLCHGLCVALMEMSDARKVWYVLWNKYVNGHIQCESCNNDCSVCALAAGLDNRDSVITEIDTRASVTAELNSTSSVGIFDIIALQSRALVIEISQVGRYIQHASIKVNELLVSPDYKHCGYVSDE